MEAIEIDTVRETWIAALNQGSIEGFVNCTTSEAVWLPPRGQAVEGREALKAWLMPLFEQFRYEFSVSDVYLRHVGGWAVEEANFLSILHPRNSTTPEPLVHEGRYLLIWKCVDDRSWLIDRYVDRTEVPSRQ